MKKSRKFTKIILISMLICNSLQFNSYAIDEKDNPYELNKNYKLTVKDIDSEDITRIYNPQGTEIPEEFCLNSIIDIPVANQENLGLCDTFATVKSAETNYALKSGKYIDLSERYLDYMTSNYYYGTRESGILAREDNDYMSQDGTPTSGSGIMTFLETFGAPTEKDVPYKNYSDEEIQGLINFTPALRVTSTIELPSLQDLSDIELKEKWIDILKIHIMKYGSINSPICWTGGDGFNEENNAQHYKSDVINGGIGHAISIVGWDDSYPKENFTIQPEHDGAFICLNSWGEDFGNNGYFYISYDDDNITVQLTGVLDSEIPERYNKYTYSEKLFNNTGFIPRNQYPGKQFYGMKFTKNSENEYLSHITIGAGIRDSWTSSWVGSDGSSGTTTVDTSGHKVKVYLNPYDDSFEKSKMILLEETNSITLGTNTNINLDKPIEIVGDKFSLVFEFGNKYNGNILDLVWFTDSCSSGNLYSAYDFDSLWELEGGEFPVYAFTINKSISNISIKNPPNKTIYEVGDNFDKTGMQVVANYNDGSSVEITDFNIIDGENLEEGQENVTVSYKIDGIVKTTVQDITVRAKGQEELKVEIKDFDKFEKDGNLYIELISPTAVNELLQKITTNGTIELYKNNEKIIDTNIKLSTGMELIIKHNNISKLYYIVVLGDVTGDSEVNQLDLLMFARYKAGFEKELEKLKGAYLLATDIVNNNNVAEDVDLLKLARILVDLDDF